MCWMARCGVAATGCESRPAWWSVRPRPAFGLDSLTATYRMSLLCRMRSRRRSQRRCNSSLPLPPSQGRSIPRPMITTCGLGRWPVLGPPMPNVSRCLSRPSPSRLTLARRGQVSPWREPWTPDGARSLDGLLQIGRSRSKRRIGRRPWIPHWGSAMSRGACLRDRAPTSHGKPFCRWHWRRRPRTQKSSNMPQTLSVRWGARERVFGWSPAPTGSIH